MSTSRLVAGMGLEVASACTRAQGLITILQTHLQEVVVSSHQPLMTSKDCEESACLLPGIVCKTLFVQDKRQNCYLLVVPHNKSLQLNSARMRKLLEASKALSFCSTEELHSIFGVLPGELSPLALLDVEYHELQVVIDQSLEGQCLTLLLATSTMSASLSSDSLCSLLTQGEKPYRVRFADLLGEQVDE